MRVLAALLLSLLLVPAGFAQDPALKDQLAQAKQLWAEQGDREGAMARFQEILAALEPRGRALGPEWLKVLVETHAWMAVLDDRQPARRPQAQKHLDALLDLDPDADLDKVPFNARLQSQLEASRATRFGRLALKVPQEGVTVRLDGRDVLPGTRHLLPGDHVVEATRAGHRPFRHTLALGVRESKSLEVNLERVASTLTFELSPGEATVTLDGQSAVAAGQGTTRTVVVDGLGPGDHLLEISAPCHRTRRIAVPASFTAPLADHGLEPVTLASAQGRLDLTSPMPGGQAFLGDRPLGPLPLKGVGVCPGTHLLRVAFPEGAFTRTLEVKEGGVLTLEARPRPRLLNLGLAGTRPFAGRDRLIQQLAALGDRLELLATTAGKETPEAAMTRLKAAPETELVLWVQPVEEEPIRHVEVVVTTLRGEMSRILVKPLEEDPLGSLVAALNRMPPLEVKHGGVGLLDLPGSEGPWVLEASEAARAAGIRTGEPLGSLGGTRPATAAEARRIMAEAAGDQLPVVQGGRELTLPLALEALELSSRDPELCYPALLVQLRLLQRQAASGAQGLLAFHEAVALQHFQAWERAAERLRDARTSRKEGVSQGTLDYHTGLCLLRLGRVLLPEARRALEAASRHPAATLWGPEGPKVAPLARQLLDELKP